MKIRKATVDDLDIVTHIEATCFPPAEAAPREASAGKIRPLCGAVFDCF